MLLPRAQESLAEMTRVIQPKTSEVKQPLCCILAMGWGLHSARVICKPGLKRADARRREKRFLPAAIRARARRRPRALTLPVSDEGGGEYREGSRFKAGSGRRGAPARLKKRGAYLAQLCLTCVNLKLFSGEGRGNTLR